ncbi:hypothetical protein C1H46_030132 [Malus baccata]|uniref:Uncharacterized protein n=1 Tax=Malus baccata TaxID=106549 RepID=A0A540LCV1_MALBA|nr:hypothetical protein C1H46_030132 [Malus baccata]
MEAIRKLRDQVAKQQQVAADGGFGCKAVVGRHQKVDYPPYGRDFVNHQHTGRFCNGKLATDISSAASKAESFFIQEQQSRTISMGRVMDSYFLALTAIVT